MRGAGRRLGKDNSVGFALWWCAPRAIRGELKRNGPRTTSARPARIALTKSD
jgi:hypothetical protein